MMLTLGINDTPVLYSPTVRRITASFTDGHSKGTSYKAPGILKLSRSGSLPKWSLTYLSG